MIVLDHLSKTYVGSAGAHEALRDINLHVEPGDVFGIIGQSGAGKSTLVRCINLLERPTAGRVLIDGADVTDYSGKQLIDLRQSIGMIFQNFSLFAQRTVLRNVTFPLELHGTPKKQAEARALELLELVGLSGKANNYPSQLSGGQQQRVAIARALSKRPDVLLLDEPLSNLDAKLRVSMRTEIRRIQQRVGITAIYVTHDQSEAMALSDQIIVMKNGVVEQMGTPQEIYYHPKNEFVADFIGEANFLRGTMTGRENGHAVIRVEGYDMPVADRPDMEPGREYTIVLRPEAAHLSDEGGVPCRVSLSCFMGSYQNYHVQLGDIRIALTEYNPQNKRIYNVGEECRLVFEPDEVHVL